MVTEPAMTPDEHAAIASAILDTIDELPEDQSAIQAIAEAQVHATLAVAKRLEQVGTVLAHGLGEL